jgi:hypothetical protein
MANIQDLGWIQSDTALSLLQTTSEADRNGVSADEVPSGSASSEKISSRTYPAPPLPYEAESAMIEEKIEISFDMEGYSDSDFKSDSELDSDSDSDQLQVLRTLFSLTLSTFETIPSQGNSAIRPTPSATPQPPMPQPSPSQTSDSETSTITGNELVFKAIGIQSSIWTKPFTFFTPREHRHFQILASVLWPQIGRNCKVVMQCADLSVFLVQSESSGFWIVGEDLELAGFVCKSWEQTLSKLSRFEIIGEVILKPPTEENQQKRLEVGRKLMNEPLDEDEIAMIEDLVNQMAALASK